MSVFFFLSKPGLKKQKSSPSGLPAPQALRALSCLRRVCIEQAPLPRVTVVPGVSMPVAIFQKSKLRLSEVSVLLRFYLG